MSINDAAVVSWAQNVRQIIAEVCKEIREIEEGDDPESVKQKKVRDVKVAAFDRIAQN